MHALNTDPDKVRELRRQLQEQSVCEAVSVDVFDGVNLPYTDNLVNAIVISGKTAIADEELK